MELRKAARQKAKLRIGISGPSGSGKTHGAILIANGIASSKDKVAIIDTESGSADLFANLGDFSVIRLEAPYTPERYIEAIKTIENAGMEVVIIDSVTHEWDGKGGLLESNELLGQTKFKGNTWAAWSVTTPRHQKFIEAIVTSKIHVITTARSKTDTIQTDDKKVKKIGLKEIQREGFEYELTVNFTLDRDGHYATASKDRTQLFSERDPFVISENVGLELKQWAESGIEAIVPPDPTIAENKKKIMQLIPMMGYILPTEKENIKPYIDQTILKLTNLELKDENLGDIVDRLEILYKEKRDNPNRRVETKSDDYNAIANAPVVDESALPPDMQ